MLSTDFFRYEQETRKIVIMCGLPGSGKSTIAKRLLDTNHGSIIISRDAIRQMIYGKYDFHKEDEDMVFDFAMQMFRSAFIAKIYISKDIILDECCVTTKTRAKWIDAIKECWNLDKKHNINKIKIYCCVAHCDVNKCISRRENDTSRTRQPWRDIITNMNASFSIPRTEEGFSGIYFFKT